MKQPIKIKRSEEHLLASAAVSAYCLVLDRAHYFDCGTPRRRDEQRTIFSDSHPYFAQFVDATRSKKAQKRVDSFIGLSKKNIRKARNLKSIQDHLRLISEQAYELLKLSTYGEDISSEQLRLAYRRAVQKVHPDRGGSHDDMVCLNNAFPEMHGMLLAARSPQSLAFLEEGSCSELRFLVLDQLCDLTVDLWMLEEADQWIRERLYLPGAYEVTSRYIIKLVAVGQMALAQEWVARLKNIPNLPVNVDWLLPTLAGEKKPKFIIAHVTQLENAYKYGAITKRRYDESKKRLEKKSRAQAKARGEHELELRRFQTQIGFLKDLPSLGDISVLEGYSPRKFISPPGYFNHSFRGISKDQKREFVFAYSSNGTLDLVTKYLFTRLDALLRSWIKHSETHRLLEFSGEAEILGSLSDNRSAKIHSSLLSEVFAEHESLGADESCRRLEYFQILSKRRLPSWWFEFAEYRYDAHRVGSILPYSFKPEIDYMYLKYLLLPTITLERVLTLAKGGVPELRIRSIEDVIERRQDMIAFAGLSAAIKPD